MEIRRFIKHRSYFWVRIVVKLHNIYTNLKFKNKSINKVFLSIYKETSWDNKESNSGQGSSLEETKELRKKLPVVIKQLNIKKILDLPCGDYNWMNNVDLGVDRYIGGDIVKNIVFNNNKKYASDTVCFKQLDLTKDPLDAVDLIICRDCLVHLSYDNINRVFNNLLSSNIMYIATTSYPEEKNNRDIVTGGWRKLNFQISPFNLPEPVAIIEEKCSEGAYFSDKILGFWKVSDLKQANL